MPKKKVIYKKNLRAQKKDNQKGIFKNLFLGIILFIILQSLFMIGGLYIESGYGYWITGIPSSIGLTLIFLIGLIYYKKSKYVLLGSSMLSFLSPLILYLIVLFGMTLVKTPLINYCIIYMTILILIVWGYFIKKILKEEL